MSEPIPGSEEWYRARAKELFEREGEIEIDENAPISFGGDPGAYVQAWVWVPYETETCADCEESTAPGTPDPHTCKVTP